MTGAKPYLAVDRRNRTVDRSDRRRIAVGLRAELGYLLSLYVGFFLFMGATDLLPEAHQHPSRLRVALTTAGFVAIFLVAYVARV